jgi:hypothetical protein
LTEPDGIGLIKPVGFEKVYDKKDRVKEKTGKNARGWASTVLEVSPFGILSQECKKRPFALRKNRKM